MTKKEWGQFSKWFLKELKKRKVNEVAGLEAFKQFLLNKNK